MSEEKEPSVMFDFTQKPVPQEVFEGLIEFYKENPKLNLGCGLDLRPGYVNVDIMPIDGLILQADVRSMPFLPSRSAEEIAAYDVLEHFPFSQTKKVLKEWIRLLKPEGTLYVRVPDMPKIFRKMLEGDLPVFEAQRLLYGGQGYAFNYHMAGFTGNYLEGLLLGCGCEEVIQIVHEENSHNVVVVARK